MGRIWLILLLFASNLVLVDLNGYTVESLKFLNETGICTFCDLRNLKSSDLDLAPGVLVTDLSGSDLRWSELSNLNWQKAKLVAADLRYAKFDNVDLKKANLESANLALTKMYRVNLKNANLDQTNFKEALFYKVNLSDLLSEIDTIWPIVLDRSNPARAFTIQFLAAGDFSDSDADSDECDEI